MQARREPDELKMWDIKIMVNVKPRSTKCIQIRGWTFEPAWCMQQYKYISVPKNIALYFFGNWFLINTKCYFTAHNWFIFSLAKQWISCRHSGGKCLFKPNRSSDIDFLKNLREVLQLLSHSSGVVMEWKIEIFIHPVITHQPIKKKKTFFCSCFIWIEARMKT